MIQLNSFNPVSKLNNISFKGNNKSLDIYDTPPDSFEKSSSFENSLSIQQEDKLSKGSYLTRGLVNGKLVYLRADYKTKALLFRTSTLEGTMGGKDVSLTVDIKGVRGTVDGKEVDLKYHKPFSHNKSGFTGTIDGKEIDIKTGSPVENTKGENDILILATFLEGANLSEKDGKLLITNSSLSDIIDTALDF